MNRLRNFGLDLKLGLVWLILLISLPSRAALSETLFVFSHTAETWGASFSKDGQRVYSRDTSFQYVWSARTGELIQQLANNPGSGRSVYWRPQTGELIEGIAIESDSNHIVRTILSPDGQKLLASESDFVTELDVKSGTVLATYVFPQHGVRGGPAYSNDSSLIAMGSQTDLYLYPSGKNELIQKFTPGSGRWPTSVAFSSDGKRLLIGCSGNIQLYDIESRTVLHEFYHPLLRDGDMIERSATLFFSPDDRYFVSHGNLGIRLWNTETGILLEEWTESKVGKSAMYIPVFSTDCRTIGFKWADRSENQTYYSYGFDIYDIQTGHRKNRTAFDAAVLLDLFIEADRVLLLTKSHGQDNEINLESMPASGVKNWERVNK